MYSATFLIAVHPSSVTSSISHRSTVTSTWREVRTRARRRPSSSSVNRPQATTYGRDSGLPILSMTAMTANSGVWKPATQSDHLGSHTAEGLLPRIPTECGLLRRLAVRRGLAVQPVADQLLVRTGEMARRQAGGPNPLGVPRAGSDGHLELIGAVARYLPALSGMRLL